jgi:hypothetical protein
LYCHTTHRTQRPGLGGASDEAIPIIAHFRARQTKDLHRAAKLETAQLIVDHSGHEFVEGRMRWLDIHGD